MVENYIFKKGLAAGVIVLLFGIAIAPSSTADSSFNSTTLKNSMVPNSSENHSHCNFTLPTVDINYKFIKWKWGEVQFEDFEPVFDVNLSHFENNRILICFNETVQCHTHGQLLPAFYMASVELFRNGSYSEGFSVGGSSWFKWDWTSQARMAYLSISKDKDNNTDIQGRITVTGIPLRLHLLYCSIPYVLWWRIVKGVFLLPFEEQYGTTAEFTLHVHS